MTDKIMMPQPDLSPVPWQNLWCNNTDFSIEIRGHKIVVPGAFLTNGASIPAILWVITYHPFDPRVILAALVHDWLYWNHQVSKEEADLIFFELLLLNGADSALAELMYKAITRFGGKYWLNSEEDRHLLVLLYYIIKDKPQFPDYRFPMEIFN